MQVIFGAGVNHPMGNQRPVAGFALAANTFSQTTFSNPLLRRVFFVSNCCVFCFYLIVF
jgi:hypothetical protein